MNITLKKLSDLRPPERNVRLHTDRQIKEFIRSLEKFEQFRPMVVDENGVILIGNGMYEAMLAMGKTEAYCFVKTGMSENDKKKLMLTDNKIFSLGVDDMQAFDEILKELGEDIDIPGFDDDLLETLTASQKEIDAMLNDYGTLTDEAVYGIKTRTSERESTVPLQRQEQPQSPDSQPESIRPQPANESPHSAIESPVGRYIICPHCGQRIEI